MDYHGRMNIFLNRIAGALAIALGGLVGTIVLAQTAPGVAGASAPMTPQASRMDADLFYQLLLGELNARNSESATGVALILDAARKTNDARLFSRAVEVAIQTRNGEAALQSARAWRQAQPNSREANRQLMQVLVALNRIADSVDPLKTELTLTPTAERAALLSSVPRYYSRVSDKKQAATLLEAALTEFLNTPATAAPAWTAIGRLRLAASDAPGAIAAASRAQSADTTATGPALLAVEVMDPKLPAAEIIVQKYLAIDNPLVEIRMGYARALLDTQRYAEAGQQVVRITQERPQFAEAWLVQGTLQAQDNQLTAGETSLKRYVELAQEQINSEERQRGLTQAYLALSQIAEKRKDYPLAEIWIAKIDSPQALVSAQNRRASILAKQGKMDEARKLLRDLPERSEADQRMKLNSEVHLLRENKLYQIAYTLLAEAVTKRPDDHELRYDLAMMAEKLERFGEMERLLRELIVQKPDYHHAYNALGYSLAERNIRLPEAKQLIQKALEFAPGDPYITDSLGWVEFRIGNKSEATKILEGAYKSKPDAEIGAHLGEVYWSQGLRDKAIAIWKEALLLNNENETLRETLKRLRVRL